MTAPLLSGIIYRVKYRAKVNIEDFKGQIYGYIPEERMNKPKLNPMPGRVVVELVDRMTEFPGSGLVMDNRYQYQPYIGTIVAFGDPTDEEEASLIAQAKERTANGERFIFTWGNGTDYSSPQMMEFPGKDRDVPRFWWLAKLRVFRIKDLAASISGGDELGGSDV
jgi:co-chaperonin GroES (HSP10)